MAQPRGRPKKKTARYVGGPLDGQEVPVGPTFRDGDGNNVPSQVGLRAKYSPNTKYATGIYELYADDTYRWCGWPHIVDGEQGR